jgi:hypothetical protein
MHPRILITTIASLALTACASASQSPASGSSNSATGAATATPTSANRITADEVANAGVATAYDAVDRLHRNWFRDYTSGGTGEVVVYMNNQKVEGGKEALRQIPAGDVALLEYLKSADAVMRFGPDAKFGAIILTRK